jgi:hypothetical protein
MILFFSLKWSQTYVNILIKFYKKNNDDEYKKIINSKNKTINTHTKNLNLIKYILKKIFLLISIITNNLNIIVLYIFIFFDLTSVYLLVFFLSNSLIILVNIILALRNNFNFLNRNNI